MSGALKRPGTLPASSIATEYGVSVRVAYAALAMLAANRYVTRPERFQCYRICCQAAQ
jgi:DNA-binding GntR family transcriptional regulator